MWWVFCWPGLHLFRVKFGLQISAFAFGRVKFLCGIKSDNLWFLSECRTDIVREPGKPHTQWLNYSCGQMQTPLPVPVTMCRCLSPSSVPSSLHAGRWHSANQGDCVREFSNGKTIDWMWRRKQRSSKQGKSNGVFGLQFSAFAFGGMQTSYTMILFLGQIASKIVFLLSAVRSGSLLCVSKKGNHSQNG